MDAVDRDAALRAHAEETATCTRCALAARAHAGGLRRRKPDAELMLVGEAPGFHEDQPGVPFVGQAGGLLDELLGGIGLTRADVYVANVLKCRPPGNRDPLPEEIAACEPHLFRQIECSRRRSSRRSATSPRSSSRAGRPASRSVHGYEQEVTLGSRTRTAATRCSIRLLRSIRPRCEGPRGRLRPDSGAARQRGGDGACAERACGSGRRARSRVGSARPLLTCGSSSPARRRARRNG